MKKGFTLIELLISISIILILFTCELNVFSHFLIVHKGDNADKRNDFSLKEALMYIEGQVTAAQQVTVIGNEIEIRKIQSDSLSGAVYTDKILFYNNNIIVRYYRNGALNGQNNIITKVGGFKVKLISNTLYVSIISNKGKEIERCFVIKSI